MKKLTALLVLILTFVSLSFAQADVCFTATYPAPYPHRVYVPARVVRHWVPGCGWVVGPAPRVVVVRPMHRLVWSRYYHRWM